MRLCLLPVRVCDEIMFTSSESLSQDYVYFQ